MMLASSALLPLAIALTVLGCRENVRNPDYCTCDVCVWRADGTCGIADAGGGEGEGEDAGEDAGEGEGECQPACVGRAFCGPANTCVTCGDDGDAQDRGCEAATPHCVDDTCVFCADTADAIDLGCSAGEPVCVAGTECVACVPDEGAEPDPGCIADLPFCDAGETCRACLIDTDCVEGRLLFCDPEDHTCRDCESGTECASRGRGLACLDDGTCAACDDSDDCDGRGCDPQTNECSLSDPGTVSQCEACVSDLDCGGGRSCVVVSFPVEGGQEVGTYCAGACAGQNDLFCGSSVGRAVGIACLTVDLRDGQTGEFCVPATTTCEAFRAHNEPGCVGVQGNCSHDGDGNDADGACLGGRCSYPCSGPADCPARFECGNDLPDFCDVD
jgi:hypothetical protein